MQSTTKSTNSAARLSAIEPNLPGLSVARASRPTSHEVTTGTGAPHDAASLGEDRYFRINASGAKYELSRESMLRCGGVLSQVARGTFVPCTDAKGRLRLDTDPHVFRFIAYFGRHGELPRHLPDLDREILLKQAISLRLTPICSMLQQHLDQQEAKPAPSMRPAPHTLATMQAFPMAYRGPMLPNSGAVSAELAPRRRPLTAGP